MSHHAISPEQFPVRFTRLANDRRPVDTEVGQAYDGTEVQIDTHKGVPNGRGRVILPSGENVTYDSDPVRNVSTARLRRDDHMAVVSGPRIESDPETARILAKMVARR